MPGGEPLGTTTVRMELRQAVVQLVEAKNTRNVPGILACYDPAAKVMTWQPEQQQDVLTSLEQYKTMLPAKVKGWSEVNRRHVLLAVEEPVLRGKELWLTYTMRIVETLQGEEAEAWARFSVRMTRQGGRWLVAEERYAKMQ